MRENRPSGFPTRSDTNSKKEFREKSHRKIIHGKKFTDLGRKKSQEQSYGKIYCFSQFTLCLDFFFSLIFLLLLFLSIINILVLD